MSRIERGFQRLGARRVLLVAALAAAAAVPACTGGKGDEARASFLKVFQELKSGSLAGTYDAFLPAPLDRDLNDILKRARGLLDSEEFKMLKGIAARVGPKVAAALEARAAQDPFLTALAAKVKDLPAALGLDTFEEFMARDAKGLLGAVDAGSFRDLARTPQAQVWLGSVDVRVDGEQGDWAKLSFIARDEAGRVREDVVQVIEVHGKWIPDAWVADWSRQMEQLRKTIADLEGLKRENPDLIKAQLAALGLLLESPAPIVDAILARLGPEPEPAAPVEPPGAPGQ